MQDAATPGTPEAAWFEAEHVLMNGAKTAVLSLARDVGTVIGR